MRIRLMPSTATAKATEILAKSKSRIDSLEVLDEVVRMCTKQKRKVCFWYKAGHKMHELTLNDVVIARAENRDVRPVLLT